MMETAENEISDN